jgi:hypothetical protein
MIGSGDVPRSKYKVEVLYEKVVLIKPDNDLHPCLANDHLNSLQSGSMTLMLMIHIQHLVINIKSVTQWNFYRFACRERQNNLFILPVW